MSFKQRRIMNYAKQHAHSIAQESRNAEIRYIDSLREEVGVETYEIEELLDKPSNWYTNRQQRTAGSHEFNIYDIELVRLALKQLQNGDDVELDEIKEMAHSNSMDLVNKLCELMGYIDISQSRLEDSLDKPDGWLDDARPEDISLRDYYEAYVFLEYVLVVYSYEGYVEAEAIDESWLSENGAIA